MSECARTTRRLAADAPYQRAAARAGAPALVNLRRSLNHSPRVVQMAKVAAGLQRRSAGAVHFARSASVHARATANLFSPQTTSATTAQRSVSVIQLGGSKWTPHSDRTFIRKLGEKDGIALFYTRDATSFYVEGFRVDGEHSKYAGAVQIEPKGTYLAMHTRSEEGMEGGLGVVMMKFAIDIAAKEHTDYEFVQLTPAPGAASKKVIELLSQKVGRPERHEQAEKEKKLRAKLMEGFEEPTEETDRDKRLQTWAPHVLPEHLLHLKALVESDRTEGIQISGPAGGLIGFDPQALVPPEEHVQVISMDEHASGYGIMIPMRVFLKIAL